MTNHDLKPDSRPFPSKCEKCERSIDDCNINWNAPREPVCVVCAYPRPAPWQPGGKALLTRSEVQRALTQLAEDDEGTP